MPIIKLNNIITVKDNYRSNQYPKPNELLNNGIPFVKTADFNNGYVKSTKEYISLQKFHSLPEKGKIIYNDLLISAYGTIDTAIFKLERGQLSSGVKILKCNKKKILKKFLFYWLKKNITQIGTISSVFKQLTINEIYSLKLNLPSIQEQQKIIDIIEPNEKLFLKYSKCVRIDNFETVQKDMKNLIDIIEPLEELKNIVNNLKLKINKMINSISIDLTEETNIFKNIETGKLNVNAAKKDGKYNFYTAGEKILKTNNFSFNGRYILLSGNGKLFVWMYDGIFDVYQRVYVLKERLDFFTTFYSLTKGLENLRQRSNGAVIKFIKKDDILSVKKYSNSHETILKEFYLYIGKIDILLELIEKLKGKFLKLLIK